MIPRTIIVLQELLKRLKMVEEGFWKVAQIYCEVAVNTILRTMKIYKYLNHNCQSRNGHPEDEVFR